MHSIKHERLEAAVLFGIQYQVHLAVSYSEAITRINSAPTKKSQSFRLDELIVHSAAPSGSWCGGQRQLSAANGSPV